MAAPAAAYPKVDPSPSFPDLERRVLERWRAGRIFERSVEQREGGANDYVFYDGPPFANGLPHFGHLLTSYAKDVVPRYRTMRGRRVERRFGWDCHGLPAEMHAEKELGVHGRQAILEYGIERFNAHCRASVLQYTGEWQRQIERAGRWVDFDRDYKTMDLSYMESVLWAFEALWKKGLVYEGYRVMPYSWAAESPVSNFETRLDDSYRERDDPALTVRFPLERREGDPGDLNLLVWTTTPWTLPSNLAAAVGPEIEYAILERDGVYDVIGAAARGKYERELGEAQLVGTVKGAELVGRRYSPPFDYFVGHPGAHVVLGADFVDTEEGTGVVHLAPGFGEDDQRVCEEAGIELVVPVDEQGRFTAEVRDWAGVNVFEANKPIAQELKRRGRILRHEQYRHSYPHCWRTREPLIYRATSSWYVEVTKLRDRMVELNREIRWIPEHVRDGQFGRWLEGARDWSISRNRFWGTPIPVWKSDDPAHPRVDVYDSLDALERDFGVRLEDLHRPAVDALTRPNPDDPTGKSVMRRVPDVLDCWFESGSMPFAQLHYPFENREWFESHFPADFITEYVAQTRGWFYTLHVLGTALFDKPPFRNVICHGTIVGEGGKKLSKSARNYPPPETVFDTVGSDALRWYLMASPVMRGGDLAITPDGREFHEVIRLVHLPLWNAWSFFALYANADGVTGSFRTDQAGVLDRYALAKSRELVESAQGALDAYDITGACQAVRVYLDALNNWFVRRSRPRFWAAEHSADKQDAYDTLFTCLHVLTRVCAPLLPFLADEVYVGLTGEESVHLADWPDARALPAERELVADMDRVRAAASAALALREEHRLRVRLPLAKLVVAGAGASRLEPYLDLLRDEVNVKAAETAEELERFAERRLKLDARALGPRLGKSMKAALAAAREGRWTLEPDGAVAVDGERLQEGEFTLTLAPLAGADGLAVAGLPGHDAVVALETATTPELEREGVARDLVRLIQQARKEAGLDVSDRVSVHVEGGEAVRAALAAHADYVAGQTLAVSLAIDKPARPLATVAGQAGAERAEVSLDAAR